MHSINKIFTFIYADIPAKHTKSSFLSVKKLQGNKKLDKVVNIM